MYLCVNKRGEATRYLFGCVKMVQSQYTLGEGGRGYVKESVKHI